MDSLYPGDVEVVPLWCNTLMLICAVTYVFRPILTFGFQQVIARHEGHLGYEGQMEFLQRVPDFEV